MNDNILLERVNFRWHSLLSMNQALCLVFVVVIFLGMLVTA